MKNRKLEIVNWKLGIIVCLCALIFPKHSLATNYGLSINPPLLRIHIKPGKTITQVFSIKNLSNTEKMFVASIIPFTKADDQGNPLLDPKTTAPWLNYFSLANSKIKLNQPFYLTENEVEQLVLTLSIPENAPVKDIYATLIVSTYENSLNQTLQGTAVRATLGANILITINSQAFPDTVIKIGRLEPYPRSFFRLGNLYFADSITPLEFTAVAENLGSFAIETKGVFRVTGPTNKPVYLEGILPVNLIAKSQRQMKNQNGEDFSFSPSLKNIGTHHISLEIRTENSSAVSTINVFFFPLKLFLGLTVSFLLIFLVIKTANASSTRLEKIPKI